MTSPRIDAARKGERRYIGKPCKVCGTTEKYVINARCVACTKQASRAATDLIKQHIQSAKEGA